MSGTEFLRRWRLRTLALLLSAAACTLAAQTFPADSPPLTALQPSAIPNALASDPIDLGALADELQRQAVPAALPGADHRLYVFVSLTMPAASLQRLIRQAALVQATVVLRGLHDGSMQKTVQAWASLQADAGAQAGLQIDPEAFDRFAVTTVPTFVLARLPSPTPAACASGRCAAGQDFVKAAGDVSLGYALRRMAKLPSAPTPVLRRLWRRVPE